MPNSTCSSTSEIVDGVQTGDDWNFKHPKLCSLDFDISNEEELPFSRGDILLVESEFKFTWTRALDWRTGNVGRVPIVLLTDELGESKAFDAFFCISRKEAEQQLLLPMVESGTYIIRPSSGK